MYTTSFLDTNELKMVLRARKGSGAFEKPALGPVSRKSRKLFGPVKSLQNLEPCDYRAVLFTYSKDEGRFPSYKKFQAYTGLRF